MTYDPKRQGQIQLPTGETKTFDLTPDTMRAVNFRDVEKAVRDIFGDHGISRCYTNGVFDHFEIRLLVPAEIDFADLEELSRRLDTKQINIQTEEGADWGDDKDADSIVITVRDWRTTP